MFYSIGTMAYLSAIGTCEADEDTMESRIFILFLGAVLLAQVCSSSHVPQSNVNQDQTAAATNIDENSEPNPNQHEEDDYYQEFLGVKGRPGIDFPNLAAIPITSFTCRNVKESGYFADMETKCQVFHICDGGRKMSFLCPNGTIFRQSHLICDWWFRVDCEDSQNYYEPSADTLRRDRERVKYDRLPSESRESMSITTNFRPHSNIQQYVQPNTQDSNIYYEPGQPLHLSNRRISTVEEQVINDDRINARMNQNRKGINTNPQIYQQKQQSIQEPQNYQRDLSHKRIVANFRSITDNGYNTEGDGSPKLVIEDGIIRAVKQSETSTSLNNYPEPEDPTKKTSQHSDINTEIVGTQGNSESGDTDDLANRRADKMRRIVRLKVKNNKNEENEGQILAETASYASSHRRGLTQDRRLETVTFSQVTERIPIYDVNSREKFSKTSTTSRPQYTASNHGDIKSTNEKEAKLTSTSNLPNKGQAAMVQKSQYLEDDLVITYRPPSQKDEPTESQSLKKKGVSSLVSNKTTYGEDIKMAVTDHPLINQDVDSVVTYRPVMDLKKFLNQRRERLTRNDDERDGKPYTGNRTSPVLPLSSSPGAIRSLALYIESLSDGFIRSTPRRVQGSLRGIIPTDPVPTQQRPGTSLHVERDSVHSAQKQQSRQSLSTTTNAYDSVSFIKYTDPQSNTKSKNGSKEIYANAKKAPPLEKTGDIHIENEPVFLNLQWNAKDSVASNNKHQNSKSDTNHKKSDPAAKKMKDYLLGNFTSEDSGLFQHINKALSQSNASLTKYSMETLYKNAIEPVLKEAMTLGSITESELAEILTTTEDSLSGINTENPRITEEDIGYEKPSNKEPINLTPFFKVENGRVSSTSSKFPEDEDLSKTPSDLRELAQVFSRALSAYLEDPETFRDALASVSHPHNPILPIRLTSVVDENASNITKFKEDEDEVLDFSDVQTPTTTTGLPLFKNPTTTKTPLTTTPSTTTPYYASDTTSSNIQTGFYITIPFITPTQKIPEQEPTNDRLNNNSHQDAEGPDLESNQVATTTRPEVNILTSLSNGSISTPTLKKAENESQKNGNNLSFSNGLSKGLPLEENLPPLETKILPPFQDAIPDHEEPTSNEEENGFTDINIPTAALDEILNEFVPEELNRLAMTSIEPDVIPDDNKYLSSYTDSLEANSLSTTDFLNDNISTTPSTSTTSTTPITPTTDLASQTVNAIVSRITAKLPQMTNPNKKNLVNSQRSTVSYDTYANHLLKAIINPVTEKDESLIQAQSASFLPSQPNSQKIPKHVTKDIPEQSTQAIDDVHSLPTEQYLNEKPTPYPVDQTDYELLPSSSVATPVKINFSKDRTKIFNATEVLSLNGGDDGEKSQHGNPRLVLLFVNDHNAKGIGLNEKNARLLKALLRKDDHHILQSVGLIPEDNDTREPTTSTTASSLHEGTSIAPPSRIILREPSTTSQLVPDNSDRTEPPITTYAPKFTIPWFPIKKIKSQYRNHTARAEKLQATDPPESVVEVTTSINTGTSNAPKYLPEKQTPNRISNSTEFLGEDKSTVSDGRAFDLLRSLYSLTARWG
ncbi:serine-rich adhesin for platelets-like isoform X2 [Hetaerina americana]|uniref:serine-rich adhesin for platelets-like isoform X2 n=1 Tax=Hetaerina americana TaxID=62018 RepID=UPI003A7F61D1